MYNFTSLAIHLDNLRIKYDQTVFDFCDGICTPRQFRRYLSGENKMSHSKLNSFCNKLGITIADFYFTYNQEDSKDYIKVYTLYELLKERRYERFYMTVTLLDKESILRSQNKRFLNYCIQKANYCTSKEHPNYILDKLCKTIDYPNCLKRNVYDFVDILSLTLIAEIELLSGVDRSLLRLKEILHNNQIMFTTYESKRLLPPIYSNVALFFCRQKKYELCNELTENGIKCSLKYNDMSSIVLLRYLKAYSLLMLDFKHEANKEAAKCIMMAISKESQREINTYYEVLIKDFKHNPLEIINRHFEDLLLN